MSVLHETVHYSASQYVASYLHDFSVCIITDMLSPLFPMAFFFFPMVWIYTLRMQVISPFAFFSYSIVKEPWTLAMLSRSKGYPHEPMPCIRFHHRCRSHVLSFVHCALIVALCTPIVKDMFSSVWFSLSSYHATVNWLPIAFAMCGVLSSSTLSTLHYRWIVCRKVRAVHHVAFRPCHPWLSRLYHNVLPSSRKNLQSFGEKFCSHDIPYPRRVS